MIYKTAEQDDGNPPGGSGATAHELREAGPEEQSHVGVDLVPFDVVERIAGSATVHGGTEGLPHNTHRDPHSDSHHDGHLADSYRDHARNTVSK